MSIEFRETMAGSFHLLEAPADERPFSFTLRARGRSLSRFLRNPVVEIEGEVDAEGFADHRLMRGTMVLDVIRTGKLPYAFRFRGNDERPYRFVGEKTVLLASLLESMTVLPGAIVDDGGRAVGHALLRFDAKHDFFKFLRSWKL
jgi:hypothetical protein